jgi:hypothetical protein
MYDLINQIRLVRRKLEERTGNMHYNFLPFSRRKKKMEEEASSSLAHHILFPKYGQNCELRYWFKVSFQHIISSNSKKTIKTQRGWPSG